jgi:Family of unknown function (DUF6941)
MRASLILADYAAQDTPGGKVHLMGAGWSVTGPAPTTHAVAAFVKVSWDETNIQHTVTLRLVNSDGEIVSVPGPEEEQRIEFPGNLEVPRPTGIPHGSEIDATFVVNIGALPLTAGQRYRWELEIDGELRASEPFLVRSAVAAV